MSSRQLLSEDLGRSAQKIIGKVRITLGRNWVGVTEQTPDDGETHAAGNQMRSVSVSVIVNAVVFQSCRCGHRLPEPLQVGDWPVYLATPEKETRNCLLHLHACREVTPAPTWTKANARSVSALCDATAWSRHRDLISKFSHRADRTSPILAPVSSCSLMALAAT